MFYTSIYSVKMPFYTKKFHFKKKIIHDKNCCMKRKEINWSSFHSSEESVFRGIAKKDSKYVKFRDEQAIQEFETINQKDITSNEK